MKFEFLVSCEVERIQGKFATRDEIEDQFRDALESADPGQVDGDEGGEYSVTDWIVEPQDVRKRSAK